MTTAIQQDHSVDELLRELDELTKQPNYSSFQETVHALKNKTFSPPQHVIIQQHTQEKTGYLQQTLDQLQGISHKTIQEMRTILEERQFLQTVITICHAKNPYQKELWDLLALLPTTTKKIVLLDYDHLLKPQELEQTLNYVTNYAVEQTIENIDFLAASQIEQIELSTVQDNGFLEQELQQVLVKVQELDNARHSDEQKTQQLIAHYSELNAIQLKHLSSNYEDVALQGNLEAIIRKPAKIDASFEQNLTTYITQAKSIFNDCKAALQIQSAHASDTLTTSVQQLWAPIILKHTKKLRNTIKLERFLFLSLLFLPVIILLAMPIYSFIEILVEPGQLVGVVVEKFLIAVVKKLLALPSMGALMLLAALIGYFIYGLVLYVYFKHHRMRRLKKLTLQFNAAIQDTIHATNQQFVTQLMSMTARSTDSKELQQFPAIVKFMRERGLT